MKTLRTIYVDHELWAAFKELCSKNRKSISGQLSRLIEKELDRAEKNNG